MINYVKHGKYSSAVAWALMLEFMHCANKAHLAEHSRRTHVSRKPMCLTKKESMLSCIF